MSKWPVTSLHGKLHVKHGYPFKSEYFSGAGEYIVLTPGNFYEEGGFKRQAGKEKFYLGDVPKDYLHKKGDLIVAMTEQSLGLLGSCAFVPDSDTYLHNQRLGLVTTDPEQLDINFVYYLFQTKSVREQIRLTSTGSKVKHTSPERIYSVNAALPKIKEQRRIAAVLSALDAKIDCNNRIIAELEAMAKTLYGYWFVQFDFPDANGKPYKSSSGKMVYDTTLKREIPEGWGVDRLGNLTSLIRRGLSPNYVEIGGMLVLNQKCIRDQRVSFLEAKRHAIVLEAENERLLRPFDVLINSTGVGTLGRIAFIKRLSEEKTTVDSHVTIVRPDTKKIHPEYLAWTVLHFQPVIESAANGSTGQIELNKTFIEDLNVVVPSSTLQEQFSKFVNPLVKALAAREKETEQIIQLRDWLLPLLMNGQITVA